MIQTVRSHIACGRRLALAILVTNLLACAEPPELASLGEVGELSVPLTVTSAGQTYRLSATFVLRAQPVPDAPVLRTLSTQADPDATTLRATLDPGRYFVFLQPGWVLERFDADHREPLEAHLTSDNPRVIDIGRGERARIDFQFALDELQDGDGQLVIGIGVAGCGNGTVEPGETCDDGPRNAAPGRCDSTCAFVCTGNCPLRVRPGAQSRGTGISWPEAIGDLRTAIDHQAALGGGEVWVLGGSHPSLDSSTGWLLSLRSGVHLRGGFAGSERTPADRGADLEPTILRDTRPIEAITPEEERSSLIEVFAARDVLMEHVRLEGNGDLLSVRQGSENVTLRDVEITGYRKVLVDSSDVRFERATLVPGTILLGVVRAVGAKVGFFDTTFVNGDSTYRPGCLSAFSSLALLQRVRCGGQVYAHENSDLLVIDSAFTGASARGNYFHADRGTIVGSQFVNTEATEPAPVTGDSLFVWNSSFVRLRAFQRGGTAASAIFAPSVEVAASTFFDNFCTRTSEPAPCTFDIVTEGASRVHNSLFVYSMERQYPTDPSPRGIRGTSRTSGNCGTPMIGSFVAPADDSGQVRALRSSPCGDRGDNAELEAARKRLLARVEPFLGVPFNADLSRYAKPEWWRTETTASHPCSTDADTFDPGRHFPRSSCP